MTREPAQRLDGGHLARENEEAICDGATRPGEKFWEKRGGGGRRAGGGKRNICSCCLHVRLERRHLAPHTHGTTRAQLAGGLGVVRGQRSASCCDTSRILLPTSLWGVCFLSVFIVCVCVCLCCHWPQMCL